MTTSVPIPCKRWLVVATFSWLLHPVSRLLVGGVGCLLVGQLVGWLVSWLAPFSHWLLVAVS